MNFSYDGGVRYWQLLRLNKRGSSGIRKNEFRGIVYLDFVVRDNDGGIHGKPLPIPY
jgi:hypothetical protein